jgi:phenylacetate-CoA ligase
MRPLSIFAAPTNRRRVRLARANALTVTRAGDVHAEQLARLNRTWKFVCEKVPCYRKLLQRNNIPHRFASLEEFRKEVPISFKADVRSHPQEVFINGHDQPGKSFWWATGGSTAEPLRFPKLYAEVCHSESAEWWLRSLIGIAPSDPSFRLWGHSHILGKGIQRTVASTTRAIKDRILGMTRVSAYDLSDAAVTEGLMALTQSNAVYGVGYAKAWEYYAHCLSGDAALQRQLPQWEALIATAESFTSGAHRDLVEQVFGTRVLMDYGTMETGPVAQEVSRSHYIVAWPQFLLETVDNEKGASSVLVTTLFERAFPLVRYDLGDTIVGGDQQLGTTSFSEVLGRSNPTFLCPDGARLHSGTISQVLRGMPWVRRFQVGVTKSVITDVIVVAEDRRAFLSDESEIRRRLDVVNVSLASVRILLADDVRKTAAGKRPTFITLD